MHPTPAAHYPSIKSLVHGYAVLLVFLLILAPGTLSLYLYHHEGNEHVFHAPVFHEIIIPIVIAFSAFVSLITFRCYQLTGKVFQRWLLMGLVAFTIIYAPHGFLTLLAEQNPWLFILYGPSSRLVMSACFFFAILHFGPNAETEKPSEHYRALGVWIAVCLVIDFAVAGLALSSIAGVTAVRWSMEILATLFCTAGILLIWLRGIRNQLMLMYAAALALFAQSSLTFMFCPAWSHLWWYAHLIFAGGFGLLSYGVAIAFKRTGAFEDVYSQEELMEKLREANANFERSNLELSQYAHLVSHDLQAPVRHISSFIHLLRDDTGDQLSEESQDYLDQIQRSASRMGQLIKGILDLSSLDKKNLANESIDLNQLFDEIQDLFRDELETSQATFHCESLPIIQGDRVLLFQVFQNLVQNAIKYRRTDRPLHIDITASEQGDLWSIAVSDNGSGFDIGDKDKIFRLFGRLHAEEISGTGAGLAICSKIVDLHGGHLDAESEIGRGARFYVYLPKRPPQAIQV